MFKEEKASIGITKLIACVLLVASVVCFFFPWLRGYIRISGGSSLTLTEEGPELSPGTYSYPDLLEKAGWKREDVTDSVDGLLDDAEDTLNEILEWYDVDLTQKDVADTLNGAERVIGNLSDGALTPLETADTFVYLKGLSSKLNRILNSLGSDLRYYTGLNSSEVRQLEDVTYALSFAPTVVWVLYGLFALTFVFAVVSLLLLRKKWGTVPFAAVCLILTGAFVFASMALINANSELIPSLGEGIEIKLYFQPTLWCWLCVALAVAGMVLGFLGRSKARAVAPRAAVSGAAPAPAPVPRVEPEPDAADDGPRCPNCGSRISMLSSFCGACGYRFRKDEPTEEPAPEEPAGGIVPPPEPESIPAASAEPTRTEAPEPLTPAPAPVSQPVTPVSRPAAPAPTPAAAPAADKPTGFYMAPAPATRPTAPAAPTAAPTPATPAERTCPNCGHPLSKDAVFCGFCRYRLSGAPRPAPSPEPFKSEPAGKLCPRCKTRVSPGALVCPRCGLGLTPSEMASGTAPSVKSCPICHKSLPVSARFCSKCGYRYPAATAPAGAASHPTETSEAEAPKLMGTLRPMGVSLSPTATPEESGMLAPTDDDLS